MSFVLWFDLFEITGFNYASLSAEIQVGTQAFGIPASLAKKGRYVWKSSGRVPSIKIMLPKELEQIPDLFLHVYTTTLLGVKSRVAYYRMRYEDVADYGTDVKIKWRPLKILSVDPSQKAFALFSINLGFSIELDRPRPIRPTHKKGKFEVWCQIIKARNLPVSDSGGKSDPYVAITVNGKFKRTNFIENVISPEWNELVRFRTILPIRLELSNDILVEVYDTDAWLDDLMGSFTVNPGDMRFAASEEENFPPPRWFFLTKEGNPGIGALLASFIIHKIRNVNKKIPRPIMPTPEFKKCLVYVLVIGTRKLLPFRYSIVAEPYVQLRIGNNSPVSTSKGFQNSKKKADCNHNYLEILKIEADIPLNPIYAPSLDIAVMEDRSLLLGGTVTIGASAVSLGRYLPWISKEERQKVIKEEIDNIFKVENNQEVDEFHGQAIHNPHLNNSNDDLNRANSENAETEEENNIIERDFLKADVTTSNFQCFREIEVVSEMRPLREGSESEEEDDETQRPKVSQTNRNVVEEDDYQRPEVMYSYERELDIDQLPFEIFKLNRAFSEHFIFCGSIKMTIKMCEHSEEGDPQIEEELQEIVNMFKECDTLVARMYLLNANHLAPRNYGGNSADPFLWIRQYENSTEYCFKNRIFTNNLNPEVMTSYPIPILLPDNAFLKLAFWHKASFPSSDNLIGETEFDLENRFFHPKYQTIVKNSLKGIPIEKRTLRAPNLISPQGAVRLWLEILTLEKAQEFPPEEIQPSTSDLFELRVVIWTTKSIPLQPKKVNIIVKCSIYDSEEGNILKETDVHYNSRDGFGEFNWRMKFRIRLPSETPRLNVAAFHSTLTSEETIADANIDLSGIFAEVHRLKSDKKLEKTFVSLSNPSKKGKDMGAVEMEMWVLPASEADLNPVGEERNEPNKDPYLSVPESGRSMADFLSDLKDMMPSLDFFGALFKRMMLFGIIGIAFFLLLFVKP